MHDVPLGEEESSPYERLRPAARVSRSDRDASLRALHVLEDALSAPAPRRQRTWLHRVTYAVDALATALEEQTSPEKETLDLLSEIALCQPRYVAQIERLRQEQLDLRIAVTSLREQIEPDPEFAIDTADIRERLASIARRYRQHRAREADLVYDAVNIDLGLTD